MPPKRKWDLYVPKQACKIDVTLLANGRSHVYEVYSKGVVVCRREAQYSDALFRLNGISFPQRATG